MVTYIQAMNMDERNRYFERVSEYLKNDDPEIVYDFSFESFSVEVESGDVGTTEEEYKDAVSFYLSEQSIYESVMKRYLFAHDPVYLRENGLKDFRP